MTDPAPTRAMRMVTKCATENGWKVIRQQQSTDFGGFDWQHVSVSKEIADLGTVRMDAEWRDGKIAVLSSNIIGYRVLSLFPRMRHFREALTDPLAGYTANANYTAEPAREVTE